MHSNQTEKGYVSHPPTQVQQERIKAACATTRQESVDAENLLRESGYSFRTVAAATGTVSQVRHRLRSWRNLDSVMWHAIRRQLRMRGVDTSNPVTMMRFHETAARLAWENQVEADEWNAPTRYPYYWESEL
jgi:hypothetical protein